MLDARDEVVYLGRMLSRGLTLVFVVASLIACNAEQVAVSPRAAAVQIAKADPPAGSREIGPIEVTHGGGCGAFGTTGNFQGALALLRNRAVQIGANYVEMVTITEPHQEPNCLDQGYTIRGIGFVVPPRPPAVATAGSSSAAPSASACDPPCSPGYACQQGACIALCNPPCSPGFVCAQTRTCEPAAAPR